MATKTSTRTRPATTKAPKAKAPAKTTKAPAKVEATRRPNRSNADWDKLAKDKIVPALQRGVSMTEIRAQYGAGPTIRRALDRIGYNTKGERKEHLKVTAKGGKALATQVAKLRRQLVAWWELEHVTGKSQDELKALLAKYGQNNLAEGRVLSERGRKRAEKAAA